ncbi:hypothetical protein Tco_1420061 [Tanacetum coccineum]
MRHSRFVLSDTEIGEDDSSKQGRNFSNEGVQDDEGVHEKASNDTEIFVQEVTPTELIQDQEGSGKASDEGYQCRDARLLDIGMKKKGKSYGESDLQRRLTGKNQGNFKITDFKGMSYNEVRPIFEKIWDFNQKFVPMDAEKASKKQKSPEKERSSEKIVEEEAVAQEEKEEVVKEPAAKRKKSIPRKTTRKRQKLEEDTDKDELKTFLDIVPREDAPIEVDSLSTKFPIVDWKTVVLTETFMYYQVFKKGCRNNCFSWTSDIMWYTYLVDEQLFWQSYVDRKEESLESVEFVKDVKYKNGGKIRKFPAF